MKDTQGGASGWLPGAVPSVPLTAGAPLGVARPGPVEAQPLPEPLLGASRSQGLTAGAALRLHLLRIAAETAPRLTGGVRVEDVVARAKEMERYVLGVDFTPAPPKEV
jgi:hypothetical protein